LGFSYAVFSLPYFLKTVNTAAIAYSMYVGALQTRRCSIFDLGWNCKQQLCGSHRNRCSLLLHTIRAVP